MEKVQKCLADIEYVGGHPALDFVNTVHSRFEEDARDYLQSYEDVVQMQLDAGLITAATAKALLATAKSSPRQAAAGLKCAHALRETLYRIFLAIAHDKMPDQADMDELNDVLASHRTQQRLQAGKDGVAWQWRIDPTRCVSLIGPIACAAAELLTSDKTARIKECPAPDGCGWLFLDTSRNRSRHWCSMKTCGNLAKVRRHRQCRTAN